MASLQEQGEALPWQEELKQELPFHFGCSDGPKVSLLPPCAQPQDMALLLHCLLSSHQDGSQITLLLPLCSSHP